MRLEHLPILVGVLVAVVGVGLVADAWLDDATLVPQERRRRARAERNRVGEGIVGGGVLCMAAALVGGDGWRFGIVAVILGVVLLAVGAALNRTYLRELIAFRGPARRRPAGEEGDEEERRERLRIR